MTTTGTGIRQGIYRFNTGSAIVWEHEARPATLPADLAKGPADQWLWCFECERAFQTRDAQSAGDEVACAYLDCAGAPDGFWKWESYRSFSGRNEAPAYDQLFPLATAA